MVHYQTSQSQTLHCQSHQSNQSKDFFKVADLLLDPPETVS